VCKVKLELRAHRELRGLQDLQDLKAIPEIQVPLVLKVYKAIQGQQVLKGFRVTLVQQGPKDQLAIQVQLDRKVKQELLVLQDLRVFRGIPVQLVLLDHKASKAQPALKVQPVLPAHKEILEQLDLRGRREMLAHRVL
jgi:hypothetical protein